MDSSRTINSTLLAELVCTPQYSSHHSISYVNDVTLLGGWNKRNLPLPDMEPRDEKTPIFVPTTNTCATMKKLLTLLIALLTVQGMFAETTDAPGTETATAETTATAEASTPAETTPPAQAAAPATPKVDKIIRGYHTYYYQGKSMTDDELETFLRNNCPEAYRSYKIGSNMRKGGIISLSVGAPVMVGGIVMLAVGFFNDNYGLMVGGGSAATVGGLACDAGIALTIVGSIRRNRAYNAFNERCAENPLTLSLQTGSEGVGLALTF